MSIAIMIIILAVYIGVGYPLVKYEKKIEEEKNKKKSKSLNKRLKKILYFFCIALFIFILISIFLKPMWLVFALGTSFAFIGEMGFILLYFEKNNKDNKFNRNVKLLFYLFFSIVGLIMMIISAIIYLTSQSKEIMMSFIIPLLGLITMLVIGLGMIYFGIKGLKPLEGCTVEVYATCIKLMHAYINSTDNNGHYSGDIVYCPVYEYSYNGIKYTESDDVYTNRGRCPNEGENILIKINPDNPSLFWDSKRRTYVSILQLILGAWFVILSGTVLVLFLSEHLVVAQ